MIHINLLPVRAARKKETLRQQLIIGAVLLVIVCAGLFYVDSIQKSRMKKFKNGIKKNNAEIARLKTVIGEVSQLKAQKKALEDKTKVIDRLQNRRTGPVRMMDALSSIIPAKAWITSLKESGKSIKLSCMAVNEEVISDFMINMEKSPFFSGVRLSAITNVGGGSFPRKKFGLSARLLRNLH